MKPSAPESSTPAADLRAAARSMAQAPSYSFSGMVVVASAQVRIAGRFQSPDRLDEMVQIPGHSPFEVILAGSESFVRGPETIAWRRASSSGSFADPRAAFEVLTQTTAVSASGESYRFTVPATAVRRLLSGSTSTEAGSGSVLVRGGRITHLLFQVSAQHRPLAITLDYQSIGTAPPVTVPAGG